MEFHCVYGQVQGGRSEQQDRYLVDDARGLFAVADGMGGSAGGAEAATIAIDTIRRLGLASPAETYWEIWHQLYNSPTAGGTTATALWIHDGFATVAHIGDCRCYRLRDGVLGQLTADHSAWAGSRLLERCLMWNHQDCEPDVDEYLVLPWDVYLLVSDGITREVTDAELETLLSERKDQMIPKNLERMVESLLSLDYDDNATVVALEVLG